MHNYDFGQSCKTAYRKILQCGHDIVIRAIFVTMFATMFATLNSWNPTDPPTLPPLPGGKKGEMDTIILTQLAYNVYQWSKYTISTNTFSMEFQAEYNSFDRTKDF